MRAWIGWLIAVVAAFALALTGVPSRVLTQGAAPQEEALPTRVVIDVDNPERALYRIAIPDLIGSNSVFNPDLHQAALAWIHGCFP